MRDADLQAEQLVVLPQRLETIHFRGGGVSQRSFIDQNNFNNQIGGRCFGSSCDQFSSQRNFADVDQDVRQNFGSRGWGWGGW